MVGNPGGIDADIRNLQKNHAPAYFGNYSVYADLYKNHSDGYGWCRWSLAYRRILFCRRIAAVGGNALYTQKGDIQKAVTTQSIWK